jgi:hypothetical protein
MNYFRQPAIYTRLPSNGEFWPPGSLEMTDNQEFPVYPMTARDEITYRTPDALFNGSAVVSVVQSCVPNIKNAWVMPGVDIDAIMIAIRIATFGHDMPIGSRCPACGNEDDYTTDLRMVNETIVAGDYHRTLKLGDLELYFRPLNYKQINANSLAQFEQQKMMANIEAAADASQEIKSRTMSEALKNLTDVTMRALAHSINIIRTPTSLVNDPEQIEEWVNNCDRKTFATVRDFVLDLRKHSEIRPLHIKCHKCGHEYEQPFTLDMTSFFADAS